MKAIYITIKQAVSLSAWKIAANMYNSIGLECESQKDAKYYTLVILIVLIGILPIFIIPAAAIYFSMDLRADRKTLDKNKKTNNHGNSRHKTYRSNSEASR